MRLYSTCTQGVGFREFQQRTMTGTTSLQDAKHSAKGSGHSASPFQVTLLCDGTERHSRQFDEKACVIVLLLVILPGYVITVLWLVLHLKVMSTDEHLDDALERLACLCKAAGALDVRCASCRQHKRPTDSVRRAM